MERFDIYIRRFGPGREPAAERLSRVFGLPVERARELVASLPRLVKRGVPEEQLERYVDTLGEIGAEYDLRPSPIAPTQVIAVGSASAAGSEARVDDGATLMLPPPREQLGSAPRFAGTVVQGAPLPELPPPAPQWVEPTSSFGTADTLRERSEDMVESGASLPRSSGSTWLEARSSAPPPARGPNDTLVESHPAGSMVSPGAPAPPMPMPPMPPPSAMPDLPLAFGVELEQRAPDSRLMHVHAPTVRSFQTLAEATAPVVAPVSSRGFDAVDPWADAPAPAHVPASVEPAVSSRARDWTQPQGSPPVPSVAPPSVVPASLAYLQPLSEAWSAIEPVSPAELGPRRAPRSSRPAPAAHASEAPEPGMQLFGHEEYVALTAEARADYERDVSRSDGREPPLSVTPPGMWEGRRPRGSQRPPAVAAAQAQMPPQPLPLPPGSLQAALQAPTRPSARPPASLRLAESTPELPLWLRWTLRVGIGASLFVIVGTLRQCRAIDDDIEQALAKWQVRPSVSPGAAEELRAAASAANSRAALGPVALDWMRADLNQFSNGDKDRVRGLVQRFKDAGALEVYVGTISEAGMVKIAGELLVVLPADSARRAAVAAVHEGFLRATFGAFAPHSDPKAEVLRVTL